MVIDSKAIHPERPQFSIHFIGSGIIIDFREEHPLKISFPICLTELGIMIDFKDLHPQYLQPVITQHFASNKSEIWS